MKNLYLKMKKLFKNAPACDLKSANEKKLEAYIERAQTDVKAANHIISIIVEYLNYSESIQSLERGKAEYREIQNNSKLVSVYYSLLQAIGQQSKYATLSKMIQIPIKELPILLNPWHGDRVVDNFKSINDNNVFDGTNKHYQLNIQNSYFYPMNIIFCDGGNHSQFSARYKNLGITIVKGIYNFSDLYDEIAFDGNGYYFTNDKCYIEINESSEIVFYSGVLFEIGRFLLKSKYYDLNFPDYLVNF